MNIRQLFYFCAAARLGSFSHAASELGVSVQAVSKALSELEEELGEPLFFRGSTGSQLTTFGEALFPYAEKATVSFKRTKEKERRSLRIQLLTQVLNDQKQILC